MLNDPHSGEHAQRLLLEFRGPGIVRVGDEAVTCRDMWTEADLRHPCKERFDVRAVEQDHELGCPVDAGGAFTLTAPTAAAAQLREGRHGVWYPVWRGTIAGYPYSHASTFGT